MHTASILQSSLPAYLPPPPPPGYGTEVAPAHLVDSSLARHRPPGKRNPRRTRILSGTPSALKPDQRLIGKSTRLPAAGPFASVRGAATPRAGDRENNLKLVWREM